MGSGAGCIAIMAAASENLGEPSPRDANAAASLLLRLLPEGSTKSALSEADLRAAVSV